MFRFGTLLGLINSRFGGSSAPSEVVILPETELTVVNASDDGGQYMLTTPFENKPTGGSTCKFIWGGVEYTSPVVDATAVAGAPFPMLVFGNTDFMGFTEVLGSNPAPDAPYFGMMYPDGMEDDGVVQYLAFTARGDIVVDPPVLSIVLTDGAASGGESAGGGIFEVNVPVTKYNTSSGHDFGEFDKTFAELVAAHNAGKYVRINAGWNIGYSTYGYVIGFGKSDGQDTFIVSMPASPTMPKQVAVYMLFAGDDGKITVQIMGAD